MPAEDDNSKLSDFSQNSFEDHVDTSEPAPKTSATSVSIDLPNLDFSLPVLPDIDLQALPGADTSLNSLPADLTLPTFPELESAAWLAKSADNQVDPADAVNLAEEAATVVTKAPEAPLDQRPPFGPRRTTNLKQPVLPQVSQNPSFFSSPEVELPKLATLPTQTRLTLLGSVGAQPTSSGAALARWLLPLGGTVLVVGGALVWWLREPLVSFFVGKPASHEMVTPPSAPTKHEQALKAFAQGMVAYEAKNYTQAIQQFEQTLQLETHFADAHRSLGIVYAVLHEQDQAVMHYKLYLAEKSDAKDRAAVQKIITDYEQDPKRAQPAAPVTSPGKLHNLNKASAKKNRAAKSSHKKHHRH